MHSNKTNVETCGLYMQFLQTKVIYMICMYCMFRKSCPSVYRALIQQIGQNIQQFMFMAIQYNNLDLPGESEVLAYCLYCIRTEYMQGFLPITICPRRCDPFQIVSYNTKRVTTSLTYSTWLQTLATVPIHVIYDLPAADKCCRSFFFEYLGRRRGIYSDFIEEGKIFWKSELPK